MRQLISLKRWPLLLLAALVLGGVIFAALQPLGDGDGTPAQTLPGSELEEGRAMPAPAPLSPFAESKEGALPATGVSGDVASDGGVAPALPGLLERKIIRNAYLELEVTNVLRSVQEVENIAAGAGGFVAASSVFTDEPPVPLPLRDEPQVEKQEPARRTQVASVTIRVPSNQYQRVLNQLRGLAQEVRAENSSTSDVSEEFADLEARLRNLEATEATYLKLLGQATSIQDILILQDRINSVRLEIERIQGRLNLVNSLSDLATIQVQLGPFLPGQADDEGQGWAAEVAEGAWETSLAVLRALGSVAIVGAVVLAWLAIPVAAGVVVWRLFWTRRPRGGEA